MAKKTTSSEKRMGTNASATLREFELAQKSGGAALNGTLLESDRLLSLANRRLYRQGRMYRVNISLNTATADTITELPVYALCNNWYVRKAISLASDMYDMAVSEERATVGSARWNDFRIKPEMPSPGVPASNTPVVYPLLTNYNGTDKQLIDYGTTGEFNYSQVEVGGGGQKTFCLGRTSSGSFYNIFEEFDKMGPNPPESPVGSALGGYDLVEANYNKQNVEDLLNKGNLPPYEGDLTTTTPAVWVKVGTIGQNATGTGRYSTGFFDAPLGMVWIPDLVINDETGLSKVRIEFQSGDYKGVMSHDI